MLKRSEEAAQGGWDGGVLTAHWSLVAQIFIFRLQSNKARFWQLLTVREDGRIETNAYRRDISSLFVTIIITHPLLFLHTPSLTVNAVFHEKGPQVIFKHGLYTALIQCVAMQQSLCLVQQAIGDLQHGTQKALQRLSDAQRRA